ncbi:ABC transporter ATP-binding protein [Alteromonas ponticola]|uniref:ABC transporter ATP-binding protein n=1 Tax=Alteromonas ponticola TaxID=2720613 RepID=A0ABX1R2S0_9ALTE|nr:ABC transporter ATP-binding protein [Alteromonas ponticola]NMH59362.1 ABC transporter ATP-binding protein [Alteromonas ponticola]
MSFLVVDQAYLQGRLENFSCQLNKGSAVHVLGENGAGKSSLLQLIAGLLSPDSGAVYLDGQDLNHLSLAQLASFRSFQQQGLQPVFDLPVHEYLGFFATGSLPIPAQLEQVFELNHLIDKTVTMLSGGELQRVELCRALIQVWPAIRKGRALLVFDEPLQALDIRHQLAFLTFSRELVSNGNTLLCSSHHIAHSARFADEVWCIKNGRLIALGQPVKIINPHILKRTYQCDFDVKRHANTWQIDALGTSDPY